MILQSHMQMTALLRVAFFCAEVENYYIAVTMWAAGLHEKSLNLCIHVINRGKQKHVKSALEFFKRVGTYLFFFH